MSLSWYRMSLVSGILSLAPENGACVCACVCVCALLAKGYGPTLGLSEGFCKRVPVPSCLQQPVQQSRGAETYFIHDLIYMVPGFWSIRIIDFEYVSKSRFQSMCQNLDFTVIMCQKNGGFQSMCQKMGISEYVSKNRDVPSQHFGAGSSSCSCKKSNQEPQMAWASSWDRRSGSGSPAGPGWSSEASCLVWFGWYQTCLAMSCSFSQLASCDRHLFFALHLGAWANSGCGRT